MIKIDGNVLGLYKTNSAAISNIERIIIINNLKLLLNRLNVARIEKIKVNHPIFNELKTGYVKTPLSSVCFNTTDKI